MWYRFILLSCMIITINTYAQQYRLKVFTHERYDWGVLNFVPSDTFCFSYSNGRGGYIPYATFVDNEYHIPHTEYRLNFVPEMKYDSSYNAILTFTNKKIYSFYKQYFDGNNNIVSRLLYQLPPSAPNPLFDSFNYLSNKMISSKIVTNGYYQNATKYYHYNSLGQLDTININSFEKIVFEYNTDGTVYRVYDIYADSRYVYLNLRSTYNYNTSGQLTTIIRDGYDAVSATYNRNSYREFYTYYTGNDTNEILKQTWDLKTGSWENLTKRIYSYDANHNVLSNIIIEWKNNAWDTFRRSRYTYNSHNLLASNETDFWNEYSHAWEYKTDTFEFGQSQRFTFTYEPYFPASVTSKIADNEWINLYPIPAIDNITICINKTLKYPFHAGIYDMQGKIYTEWSVQTCSAYKQTMPIDNLPTGNYCIKLSAQEGEMVKKFMVAH